MVNPAVSVSMWSLGKSSYTECFVRISGQMGGGLVAFPFFYEVSQYLGLESFGGPEFSKENDVEAFMSEFGATFLLMWAIYIVCVGWIGLRNFLACCSHHSIRFRSQNTAQLGDALWKVSLLDQTILDCGSHSIPD